MPLKYTLQFKDINIFGKRQTKQLFFISIRVIFCLLTVSVEEKRGRVYERKKGNEIIETNGKLSALFACNVILIIKVGERFCNLRLIMREIHLMTLDDGCASEKHTFREVSGKPRFKPRVFLFFFSQS